MYSTKFHLILLFVIVSKLLYLLVEFATWWSRQYTGNGSGGILAAGYIVEFIYQIIFFNALALMSKGWCVVRPTLFKHEFRVNAFISFMSALSMLLYNVFESYILVLVIVMYMLFSRFLYLNTNQNIYLLVNYSDYFRNIETNSISEYMEPLINKTRLLRGFQKFSVMYFVIIVLSYLGLKFFGVDSSWIGVLLFEFYDFVILNYLLIEFRLRSTEHEADLARQYEDEQERIQVENRLSPKYKLVQLPSEKVIYLLAEVEDK